MAASQGWGPHNALPTRTRRLSNALSVSMVVPAPHTIPLAAFEALIAVVHVESRGYLVAHVEVADFSASAHAERLFAVHASQPLSTQSAAFT